MTGEIREGDDFALAVHDLRTPLSAMRLTAELIGRGDLDARQAELLDTLVAAIDGLTDMTASLLLGQSGDGRPTGSNRTLPLEDLVREVTELFAVLAIRKGLLLRTSLPEGAAGITVPHPITVRRVLTTLIDNAIKYTGSGEVCVSLTLNGDPINSADIQVADTGPGVPVDERSQIFNKGVRGATGITAGEGHGLGLWGAQLLVREIGGRLDLEENPAGGSCFCLTVPVAEKLQSNGPNNVPVAPEEIQAHVLVVDDNDTNRRLLAALLESFGMTSDQASGGAAALDMMGSTTFDAVLLDLHMPDMDGITAAERIRLLPEGKSVPLIAVTAALESVGDKRLRQAGFQEVLTKPLDPANLYDALELARRHRQSRSD